MLKNSIGFFLSFFLFMGTFSLSEVVEAKSARTSHSKLKKKMVKKHHKASARVAKATKHNKKKMKATHKVAKKLKHSAGKKKLMAKGLKKTKSSLNRKIASVGKKKVKGAKARRRSLPKEYGTI